MVGVDGRQEQFFELEVKSRQHCSRKERKKYEDGVQARLPHHCDAAPNLKSEQDHGNSEKPRRNRPGYGRGRPMTVLYH